MQVSVFLFRVLGIAEIRRFSNVSDERFRCNNQRRSDITSSVQSRRHIKCTINYKILNDVKCLLLFKNDYLVLWFCLISSMLQN